MRIVSQLNVGDVAKSTLYLYRDPSTVTKMNAIQIYFDAILVVIAVQKFDASQAQ